MAQKKYLDYVGLQEVVAKIEEKYAPISALEFKGVKANIAALPNIANEAVGNMYTVTTGGTTTADFVEGAGKKLQDGENVVAVNVSSTSTPDMKWDIIGGVFEIEDRLQFGSAMPASPTNGQTFLYMGDTTYTYDEVTPAGTENPQAEGWYVSDGAGGYTATTDTEVQSGTTYYQKNEQYVTGVIYVYSSTSSSWVAQSSGDTMIPITNVEIDALFA